MQMVAPLACSPLETPTDKSRMAIKILCSLEELIRTWGISHISFLMLLVHSILNKMKILIPLSNPLIKIDKELCKQMEELC